MAPRTASSDECTYRLEMPQSCAQRYEPMSVRRHQTPESGTCAEGCRARRAARQITAAHQRDFADWFLQILANDGHRLRRRDVVASLPILLVEDAVEVFRDGLFSSRELAPSAHFGNYGRKHPNEMDTL